MVDNASRDGTVDYLRSESHIAGLVLRSRPVPLPQNWNDAARIARSEILVYTDDDILCPKLEPDWLARGLAAMTEHPEVGMLSLYMPAPPGVVLYQNQEPHGSVTYCHRVGGHLAFVRRELMRKIHLPDAGTVHGIEIKPGYPQIDAICSRAMQALGYRVAFLTGVYCQHIGTVSARNGADLSGRACEPIDPDTLEVACAPS